MEINESNTRTLITYLQQTLSPDYQVRHPAEESLQSVERNKNYPVLLLNLVTRADVDINIRIAGAIVFKNYVKRNWKVDDKDNIDEEDRQAIKNVIIGIMLKSPEQIQKQLIDAVSWIGREDFPKKWTTLLQEMTGHFASGDFYVINGVLHTAHCLFKRYRYEFKSQELWTEIKYVLDNFAQPFTELFVATMDLASKQADNVAALKVIFSSLVLIAKVFYSLNSQDIPEFFEDNMPTWMKNFLSLLTSDNKLLKTDEETEAGLLEQLKSQICDNVALYAQKYDEEFQPYLPDFVTAVWHLLTTTGTQVKYDLLVSNAIRFLSTVAERPQSVGLFEAPSVLGSICEKIIIPNMEFRQTDEELFEDSPEEYIRKDIEGSDVDTRRRAACDLVKALSKHFEAKITEIFSQYVSFMLQTYAKDPSSQWKNKDAAIYLVTSLAVKGQTAQHGSTKTSELVNISDFYREFILPDLMSPNVNEFPVLKADAIKYVMIFRNQLPKAVVVESLPRIMFHLASSSIVVHTYAAHAIERIFTMKDSAGGPSILVSEVQPFSENILNSLFNTLELPGSSENEYVMKAIMRTFSLLQEVVIPYLALALPKLTSKLTLVSKNPTKPHFNHYLFECLSLSIRIVCRSNPVAVTTFEEALFPNFQEILQQDIQEFSPYVFQILSLLLELHEGAITEPYMALFPCLLNPVLWERPGNVHPLVRLLQAYIEKGAKQGMLNEKLNAMLGVFQKLVASKSNDHEGFYILQSLIEYLPPESLNMYMKQIFNILFQRLTSSKTTKYVKCLLVFLSLFAYKYGPQDLITLVDELQPQLFGMVLERLFVPDVQKVSGRIERKICAVGMTRLLTEAVQLSPDGQYAHYWAPLLQALVGVFELPEDDTIPDDEHFIEIDETPGYQISYSQLVFAGKKEVDPFRGQVPEPRIHLAQSLAKMAVRHPGKLSPLISTGLAAEAAGHLQNYLQAANLQLQ